jgi:hypothetical protein
MQAACGLGAKGQRLDVLTAAAAAKRSRKRKPRQQKFQNVQQLYTVWCSMQL